MRIKPNKTLGYKSVEIEFSYFWFHFNVNELLSLLSERSATWEPISKKQKSLAPKLTHTTFCFQMLLLRRLVLRFYAFYRRISGHGSINQGRRGARSSSTYAFPIMVSQWYWNGSYAYACLALSTSAPTRPQTWQVCATSGAWNSKKWNVSTFQNPKQASAKGQRVSDVMDWRYWLGVVWLGGGRTT